MAKGRVEHYKKDCIACGACAAISPDYWELDEEGLADVKGSSFVDDHYEKTVETFEELAQHRDAAEVCPVEIIHVKED